MNANANTNEACEHAPTCTTNIQHGKIQRIPLQNIPSNACSGGRFKHLLDTTSVANLFVIRLKVQYHDVGMMCEASSTLRTYDTELSSKRTHMFSRRLQMYGIAEDDLLPLARPTSQHPRRHILSTMWTLDTYNVYLYKKRNCLH